MQVIPGERAVTIRVTYQQARELRNVLIDAGYNHRWPNVPPPGPVELLVRLVKALADGKLKGRPLPPLPKSKSAHNSTGEIVADV